MGNRRDYGVITATYWAFTLTDGALRMLVLLHLHERGFAPLALAGLFLLYELFGVLTNLFGGWIGARFGLKSTLVSGLALQVVALGMLCVPEAWLTVAWVMVAQALSGIAKDLTKMSSKSYIKLVVPPGDSAGLLRWVALLTGSKNTLKGLGFFLGGVLLAGAGFRGACLGMGGLIVVALVGSALALPRAPGKAKARVGLRHLVPRDARLKCLSAARFFLFAARDVWFVIALPVYLAADLGWSHAGVGTFLALWIIGYGLVQAAAPAMVCAGGRPTPDGRHLGRWTLALALPLVGLLACLQLGAPPTPTLVVGLAIFGVLFAGNSAMHSFLVVHYAAEDRLALSVGFYYMANAAGRLVGTLLSGLVFGALLGRVGLEACLAVSTLFVLLSAALCVPLARAELSLEEGSDA
jgi:MFS transporter, APGE family, 1-arseno-3-phosphoglycerate exporter